jgi:hypothetical protein
MPSSLRVTDQDTLITKPMSSACLMAYLKKKESILTILTFRVETESSAQLEIATLTQKKWLFRCQVQKIITLML